MRRHLTATLLFTLVSAALVLRAQSPAAQFDQKCALCHGNPSVSRAPSVGALGKMTPEAIYSALTLGVMRTQGAELSDDAKRSLATFLSRRNFGSAEIGSARQIPNQCSANPPINLSAPSFNGWSPDLGNTRFQTQEAALLTANDVPDLKLKWAFGVPGATSMYGQPTVVSGRVFFGANNGSVYALDAATGCVHWSFQAEGGVRSAILIGRVNGEFTAYFGDLKANVYAVDALTGALLWRVNVDSHPMAYITAAPRLYKNLLYVPVASGEEGAGGAPTYQCCTFRGSVIALDAATDIRSGERIPSRTSQSPRARPPQAFRSGAPPAAAFGIRPPSIPNVTRSTSARATPTPNRQPTVQTPSLRSTLIPANFSGLCKIPKTMRGWSDVTHTSFPRTAHST